ncbi:hypothetical protein [Streptomyces ziwulingensis]|uniref:hypothetical protein n=1 Tax=Streptomyces ziwulingensis TaxID=1045501 RepID=UPI0031EEC579
MADTYEKEADRFRTPQRSRWAMRDTAALFRRMACNRAAANPTRLTITLSLLIDVTQRWCQQHGYRAVAGMGGMTLQRGDEPVVVAGVDDTLLWDGERITVAPRDAVSARGVAI